MPAKRAIKVRFLTEDLKLSMTSFTDPFRTEDDHSMLCDFYKKVMSVDPRIS